MGGGVRALCALVAAAGLAAAAGALRTSGGFMTTLRAPQEGGKQAQLHVVENGFLDYYKSKFAFTGAGELQARITVVSRSPTLNRSATAACFRVTYCDVTRHVVRDSSYQMKRVFFLEDLSWKNDMAKNVCNDRTPSDKVQCRADVLAPVSRITFRPGEKFAPARNRIILINLIKCNSCLGKAQGGAKKGTVDAEIRYNVTMLNKKSRFPQLGWEEEAYPYSTATITALAIAVFIVVILASVISYVNGRDVHFVLKVLLCTSTVKIVSSSLTAAAFWRASVTGKLMIWFFVLRVPLIIIDELLIGLLMLVMSTGIGMMPATWLFDRRSSTFAVFLGLALELFTVVTSEVVFAYRYLGLIVFLFSGGTVAFIGILFSWKNTRFIAKYVKLVRMANIYAESTPLLRMRLFFNVNAALVLALWLFKIVTFGVMDHVLYRPDLLWTCFEAADLTLLVWYAFAVFPRKKSAFYVDMSNVDNVRLREVNAWHVQRAQRENLGSSENGDEASAVNAVLREGDGGDAERGEGRGTGADGAQRPTNPDATRQRWNAETGAEEDEEEQEPEPEWIEWRSGMVLPVPTTAMWNMNDDVRRVLKRQRPPPTAETQVRVLGSPMESPESLALTIAKPIIGPDAPRSPVARAVAPVAPDGVRRDRDDPIGGDDAGSGAGLRLRQSAPRGRIVADDDAGMEILPVDSDGDRETGPGSRRRASSFLDYADSEMFSVPSSTASADGEIFTEHSGKGKGR